MSEFMVCRACDGTGKIEGGLGCAICGGSGQLRRGAPRRGRPPVHKTDEERRAAKAASTAKSNAKVKNVTIDADLVEALNRVADELALVFGFRPTISQTLRHLINKRAA
jgi:RecJ-like exonuclease